MTRNLLGFFAHYGQTLIILFSILFVAHSIINAQTIPPTIQWQRCLGGTNVEQAYSILQTNEGGYIVAGSTNSNDCDVSNNHGLGDYWAVKLDTIGNIQWQKCLGGTNGDCASSIQQTNDGGYIIAGYTLSNDGDVSGNHSNDTADYWVVKLDTVGKLKWQRCLGGTKEDKCYSIKQTKDGGYIVAGYTLSNDGDVSGNHDTLGNTTDYWIVKLDTVGNIQWQKCLGGTYGNDFAYTVQQTYDLSYIVAGFTNSNNGNISGNQSTGGCYDFWIVNLDTSGNIQWQKCLGGSNSEEARSIQQTTDGGYIIAGCTNSINGNVTGNHGQYDYWVVKLGSAPLNIKNQKTDVDISIFPNPSNRKFTVQLSQNANYIEILNILGQEVDKREIKMQGEINFEINETGIYFLKIYTDREIITKKIIVEK